MGNSLHDSCGCDRPVKVVCRCPLSKRCPWRNGGRNFCRLGRMETDADADVADGEKKKISLKANTGSSFHSASGIIFVSFKN